VVYWDKNNLKKARILWNISRKVGNSVVRNRLKRWCREYVRVRLSDVFAVQGLDLNIAFRPNQKEFYKDLRREAFDKEFYRLEKRIRSTLAKDP
jgi:ribonuclease P protein component